MTVDHDCPALDQTVIYVSKVGDGIVSPAVILRTKATTNLEVIERWGPEPATVEGVGESGRRHETVGRPAALVPDLPDDFHIDLLVHGLGKDYREFNVPYDDTGEQPGSWHYPWDVDR